MKMSGDFQERYENERRFSGESSMRQASPSDMKMSGDFQESMVFSDLALSRRLERAEGHACVQFAEARGRLFPDSGIEWMEYAGAYAAYDGIDSPVTQSFGLGLFEPLSTATIEVIERFFFDRGHPRI